MVFARGTDNAIWHNWQARPDGNWSGWASLGGEWTSDPDAALNAPGGLVVFARGIDNAIWHCWQAQPDGDWSGWASLGGQWTSGPSAVLQTGGRLVVFARGTDNAIWQRSQTSANGDWGPWTETHVGFSGDRVQSGPDAALNSHGDLVVFAITATSAEMIMSLRYRVPEPPEQPELTVPRLVGLLGSQVGPALEAARLRYGSVWNPTGEIRSDRLRVVAQDPAAATSVPVDTRVNYRVELAQQQHGVSSIVLTNRHQQRRSLDVFLWDSGVRTWNSKGALDFGASTTWSLASGRVYTVVAVDRGLDNCTDGRPENVSCQRFLWGALGDSEGVQIPFEIP